MDIEEKILKFAALGWDGKEEFRRFLSRVYGVEYKITKENSTSHMEIYYKTGSTYHFHTINFKNGKEPEVQCLRLFRTKNGEVIGPDPRLFLDANVEWT